MRRITQLAVAVGTLAVLVVVWWFNADGEVTGRESGDAGGSGGSTQTSVELSGEDPASGLPWITPTDLPAEALDTVAEIEQGPPYPYDRDGVTFENREGLLPAEELGYYQEFTVQTPGSTDRGARRIVWGLEDELYYTADHYGSFARIARIAP